MNRKHVVSSKNVAISSVIAVFLIGVVIPITVLTIGNVSFPAPAGKHIKKGNRLFYNFLEEVKQNNDYLILGTSETGMSLNGNNYWALLNNDTTLAPNFYSLGGAGRCSYVYFPHILHKPEAFKDLNVILYLNPTYWRTGLNSFRTDYYSRYVSNQTVSRVKWTAKSTGLYKRFMEPAQDFSFLPTWGGLVIDNFRSVYYHDFNQMMNGKLQAKQEFSGTEIGDKGLYITQKKAYSEVDTLLNASPKYLAKNIPFPAIDTGSLFQTEMLKEFLNLVNTHQINCVVYLGPINEIYAQKKNPSLIPQYYETLNEIKQILGSSKVPYIDGTWQGTEPGTFIDVQHISEYGAYLTAMEIKEYYEKNH